MIVMTTPRKPSTDGRQTGRPANDEKKIALNCSVSEACFNRLETYRMSGKYKINRAEFVEQAIMDAIDRAEGEQD